MASEYGDRDQGVLWTKSWEGIVRGRVFFSYGRPSRAANRGSCTNSVSFTWCLCAFRPKRRGVFLGVPCLSFSERKVWLENCVCLLGFRSRRDRDYLSGMQLAVSGRKCGARSQFSL